MATTSFSAGGRPVHVDEAAWMLASKSMRPSKSMFPLATIEGEPHFGVEKRSFKGRLRGAPPIEKHDKTHTVGVHRGKGSGGNRNGIRVGRSRVTILHSVSGSDGNVTAMPGSEGTILKRNPGKGIFTIELDVGGEIDVPQWCTREEPPPARPSVPTPLRAPESSVLSLVTSVFKINNNSSNALLMPESPTSLSPRQRRVSFTDLNVVPSVETTSTPVWGSSAPIPKPIAPPPLSVPVPDIQVKPVEKNSDDDFSDSSNEDSDSSDEALTTAGRRWKFLKKNLRNIRTGMTHKGYHVVKTHTDRKRFIKTVLAAKKNSRRVLTGMECWKIVRIAVESGWFSRKYRRTHQTDFHQIVQLLRRWRVRHHEPVTQDGQMSLATAEFVQTEKTYVTQLGIISQYQAMIHPLAVRDDTKATETAVLFGNVPSLLRIHTTVLSVLTKHVDYQNRIAAAGWIIDWYGHSTYSPLEPETVFAEILAKRRSVDELQLLMKVFKDQIAARGGAREVFQVLDTNNDSQVSKSEFWAFSRKVILFSKEATARLFQQVDSDSDGFINIVELINITADMLFTRWCKAVMRRGEARAVFDTIDNDRNGLIDQDEFTVFAISLNFIEEEASSIFRIITNGQKVRGLSKDQFCKPLGLSILEDSSDIGELLQLVVPIMRSAYTQYVNNFEDSLASHKKLKTKVWFNKICDEMQASGDTLGLDLSDLLITPIQRMMRYSLLLQQTLKLLPCKDTHNGPLAQRVAEGIARVQSFAKVVDQSITMRHNYEKLKELAAQIIFDGDVAQFKLLQDGRKVLKSGLLTKVLKDGSKKPHRFYLFNDVLIHTLASSHKCKSVIAVEQVDLQDMEDQSNLKNAWMIKSPKVSFIVSAPTPEIKIEWATAVLAASDAIRRENPALLLQPLAPVWVDTKSATSCMVCDKVFNLLRRRHHCYHCGCVICRECSLHKFYLPHIDEKAMVQVCNICFEGLAAEREQLLNRQHDSPEARTEIQYNNETRTTQRAEKMGSLATPRLMEDGETQIGQSLNNTMTSMANGGDLQGTDTLDDTMMAFKRSWNRTDSMVRRKVSSYLLEGRESSPHGTNTSFDDTVTLGTGSYLDHDYQPEHREHEFMIHNLQERFVGPNKPIITKPGRKLLRSGLLLKQGKTDWRKLRFFLFSDILLCCKEMAFGKLYFKRVYPLLHAKASFNEDRDSFTIMNTVQSFVAKPLQGGAEAGDRDGWVADITRLARDHHRETGAGALDGMLAGVPQLATKQSTSGCQYCSKSFTKLNKSTHCKGCGFLHCRQCTSTEYYLSPGVKGKVCPRCYDTLRNATMTIAADMLQNPEHAPPDEAHSVSCYVCSSRFSILRPKKSCWSCCAIVCAECSPQKTILARLNPDDPLRVCNPCYLSHFSKKQ